MTTLREAAQQALEALEQSETFVPYEGFGMARREAERKHQAAITALKAALAEPTLTQQMTDAGFTPRDNRLTCDECGGKFTRQMLPIHKCAALAEPTPLEDVVTHGSAWSKDGKRIDPMSVYAEPVQEPVAWRFEARHIDSAWAAAVTLKHPGPEGVYMRNVVPLYTSPPQRKPLTETSAERTLKRLGYTDCGGEFWKPPLGAPAEPVQEPQCNPHPKAPHGFLRNASHNADRYVCECDGWEPYEAGYQAGMEAALRAQS